jgi:hypothetical protein
VVTEDDFIFADYVIYGGSTTLCAAVGLAVAIQHARPSCMLDLPIGHYVL